MLQLYKGVVLQFFKATYKGPYPKYISVQQFYCAKKAPTISGGRGVGVEFCGRISRPCPEF